MIFEIMAGESGSNLIDFLQLVGKLKVIRYKNR